MTGTLHVHWHVAPLSPPQPQRHCATCGRPRPFRSSGKVRLNANGRRLDAWLIYKCTACDRTWNLPVLDRVPVADLPPAVLSALETSDPAWVRACAFDLAVLRRHALQVALPEDLAVTKRLTGAATREWSTISLVIEAPWPTGLRLDRLLAQELRLSRSLLQGLLATGGISVTEGAREALRLPVTGSTVLQFDLDRLAEHLRPGLIQAVGVPPPCAG